jgi:hypothetical protein
MNYIIHNHIIHTFSFDSETHLKRLDVNHESRVDRMEFTQCKDFESIQIAFHWCWCETILYNINYYNIA